MDYLDTMDQYYIDPCGYKRRLPKIDFFYDTSYGLSIGDVNAFIAYFIVLFVLIVFPAFILEKDHSAIIYAGWLHL